MSREVQSLLAPLLVSSSIRSPQPSLSIHSNIPSDVADFRIRAFYIEKPIEMSKEKWDTYWPYIDNIWSYKRANTASDGRRTVYYLCRLHRKNEWVPKNDTTLIRHRQKSSRVAIGCPMKMKLSFDGESVIMIRSGDEENSEHLHDLEFSDRAKRPSAVMELAVTDIKKGYKTSVVSRNVRAVDSPDDRKVLADAGGKYLNLKDCHNAARDWLKANPDKRLKGHREPWEEQRLVAREWLEKQPEVWLATNIQVISNLILLNTIDMR
jgi:hypothetical protein